jgi:hypothetical protein
MDHHVTYIRIFRDIILQTFSIRTIRPYIFGIRSVPSLSLLCFTLIFLSIFVKFRLARNFFYPSRPLPIFLQPLTSPIKRPWEIDLNLHRLRAVQSFKESPGCKSKEELKQSFSQLCLTRPFLSSYQQSRTKRRVDYYY